MKKEIDLNLRFIAMEMTVKALFLYFWKLD